MNEGHPIVIERASTSHLADRSHRPLPTSGLSEMFFCTLARAFNHSSG